MVLWPCSWLLTRSVTPIRVNAFKLLQNLGATSYLWSRLEQHGATLVHKSIFWSTQTPCSLHQWLAGDQRTDGREHIRGGTCMHMLPHTIRGLLICLLNYISSRPRLESPLSPQAIDTLALLRLTRGFVCCGQHSRLSPDGIYYVLCFNIHSVWVEINFSFGPNCLCALAAQGSTALSLSSPRCYSGSGPPRPPHSCILYLITHVWGPQRGGRGFGELFPRRRAEGTHCWYLSGRDLLMLRVTAPYSERDSVTQTRSASGVLRRCWMLGDCEEPQSLMATWWNFLCSWVRVRARHRGLHSTGDPEYVTGPGEALFACVLFLDHSSTVDIPQMLLLW